MKLAVQPTIRTPIGIDVGAAQFKAVQLSRQRAGWRLEALAVVPRVETGAVVTPADAQRLASVLFRRGFEGRDVVLSAPSAQLVTGVFPVPPADSGAPRDQIVRMELSRSHGCDPHQLEAVSWDLPPTRGGSNKQASVMAVGCPHAAANALIDSVEQADLQVSAMDVEWMASVRAAWSGLNANVESQGSPVVAMVDLGEQAARITVLWGSVVVYARTLSEFGMGKLKTQLTASFGLDAGGANYLLREVGLTALKPPQQSDQDDAPADLEQERRQNDAGSSDPFANVRVTIRKFFATLAEELRISIAYAEEEFSGEAMCLALVGGGAGVPGIDALLAHAVGVETKVMTPTQLVSCPSGSERLADDPCLMTAVGLAMYAKGGGA